MTDARDRRAPARHGRVAVRSSPLTSTRRAPWGAASRTALDDPAAFVAALEAGLRDLADPAYLDGPAAGRARDRAAARRAHAAPGRGPSRGLTRELPRASGQRARPVAERAARATRSASCAGSPARSSARLLADDPERGLAAAAPDRPRTRTTGSRSTRSPASIATGILLEPFRWAELEQLVYSPSAAGSAGSSARPIATHPVRGPPTAGGPPEVVRRGLALVGAAHRRRRARRAEGARLGAPHLATRRPGARRRVLPARGGARRRRRRRAPGLGRPRRPREARSGRRGRRISRARLAGIRRTPGRPVASRPPPRPQPPSRGWPRTAAPTAASPDRR